MSRTDEGDYAAWQAYREMDRMPDPSLNPCEYLERAVDDLREALAWAADELDAARAALVAHGCTDDHLKNCERAAHNARNHASLGAGVGVDLQEDTT